jgi:hypothetical protein
MKLLDRADYQRVVPGIRAAEINTLFALSVLEGKVDGQVFVDEIRSPSSIYIQHPYGMSLLFGGMKNEEFNAWLHAHMLNSGKTRNRFEWLQAYPASLYAGIDSLLGGRLIKKNPDVPYEQTFSQSEDRDVLEYRRINFVFNDAKYRRLKSGLKGDGCEVVTTTERMFDESEGTVIPRRFWNNATDFFRNGTGRSLILGDGSVASTAFASFVIGNRFEIGVETVKNFHGKSFGAFACSALIDYCLANGYEPVWSCLSGNAGSVKLALKLGFEEKRRVPYYRLAK